MDEEDRRISRLLADGKIAGAEADDILERVFERLDREKAKARPVRAIRYWAGAALAAAAAVMLVVFLPRGPEPGGDFEEGVFDPNAALHVACSAGKLSACPVSASLVFSVSKKRAAGVLSAWAEPVGGEAERVFFFSKEDGGAEISAAASGAQASEHAVRLTGSLKAGRYRVHAVIADRTLSRDELAKNVAGPQVRARASVDVIVTE